MNPNSNPVPLVVILFATLVTTWNGYLQCFYLAQIENTFAPLSFSLLSASSSENAITWLGICLFFVGMGINVHSDGVLRNLRRRNNNDSLATKTQQHDQQKPEYYIPHSPFFKYISCPNLAGEILEWFGYTLASRFSLPSVAFFVYTVSNLVPRAVAHHKWYLRKFEDYPLERKWAVVPFVVWYTMMIACMVKEREKMIFQMIVDIQYEILKNASSQFLTFMAPDEIGMSLVKDDMFSREHTLY